MQQLFQIHPLSIIIVKAIILGFFVTPLLKVISINLIQLKLIRLHKLPLSGYKFRAAIPNIIKMYIGFLFKYNTNYVSCNLSNRDGGFVWAGIFKWKVW